MVGLPYGLALLASDVVAVGEVEQHRFHTAMDARLFAQPELGEQRVDVLLDRALREHEGLGARSVVLALSDLGEHLQFTRGEMLERRAAGTRPRLDQRLHDLGIDDRAARRNGTDGVDELAALRQALL